MTKQDALFDICQHFIYHLPGWKLRNMSASVYQTYFKPIEKIVKCKDLCCSFPSQCTPRLPCSGRSSPCCSLSALSFVIIISISNRNSNVSIIIITRPWPAGTTSATDCHMLPLTGLNASEYTDGMDGLEL